MKKLLITTAIISCCLTTLYTQPCLPEGITFSTQEEIDSFQINYPNCNEIEGDVTIEGNDIYNLNTLSVLTAIGGFLKIDNNFNLNSLNGLINIITIVGTLSIGSESSWGNDNITSLVGLDNLITIGGDLIIGCNQNLNSLIGLDNLSYVNGSMKLINNPNLKSLLGLGSITSIAGDLQIGEYNEWGNPNLTHLTGLENLTFIGGNIFLGWNETLLDLAGLTSLSFIGSELRIIYNPALTNLEGLESLITVDSNLILEMNENLESLNGIESLTSIGNDLNISYNNALISISGIENINPNTINHLIIAQNSSLSSCEVQSICDYIVNPNGNITIENNASGCNSPEEVEEACITNVHELNNENIFIISPNPISSTSIIEYTLLQSSPVILQILDLNSQVVISLIDEQQRGKQKIRLDGTELKPGVYFCVLKTNEGVQTMKMIKL